MSKTEIDKRVFDVYKEYGIFQPGFIIANREISKRMIGPISNTVEYNIGKRMGKILVESCQNIFEDDIQNICFEMVEKSGWGKVKINKGKNLIRIQNSLISSYYAKHIGILEEPIDNMLRGMIAEIFEGTTKKEYEINETKCIAMGDKYCEFVIREREV